jgi:hypothetical protein
LITERCFDYSGRIAISMKQRGEIDLEAFQ